MTQTDRVDLKNKRSMARQAQRPELYRDAFFCSTTFLRSVLFGKIRSQRAFSRPISGLPGPDGQHQPMACLLQKHYLWAFGRSKRQKGYPKTKPKRILWFAYPHKIFTLKSLCTTGVNFNMEMAENFFKLWIALKVVLIIPLTLWITMCISKGKI
jgi:hypothetical protein